MRDKNKTIGNIIDQQKTAYIGVVEEDGYPAIKAMLAPRIREGIRVFYFTTNTSSQHTAFYRKNPKATIYFSERRFYRGVLLRGTMEVLTDDESRRMIWQEKDVMYYPLGVTDPDYCVLKFTAESGRYYSNFKSEDFTVE
ncbi:pyridoxamine 5'-phosphate oxidase family protein [Candidatus Soleaferrea massiliensis]|uniref:pyridoxamine 5'-phosphate oxidase family protein n=1 Tax=Candidatus Soleaferrea massiliensis TaxID=1470354 RepID=UPI00058F125E|nr:pyridoxamine 5'-phosphate oxidase family protein [Candidatus Soleaferrea massiliensis]